MDWKDKLSELLPADYVSESEPETDFKKQSFEIKLDKKGRCGKQATIIYGFEGSDEELKQLAADLKKACGAGGSARGGEILVQGDFRKKCADYLEAMGHKVKCFM